MIRNLAIGASALAFVLSGVAAEAQQFITCESDDHAHHYCHVDTSGGVTLVDQKSRAGCYRDDTWGWDRNGIWVANGCRALFRVGVSHDGWQHSYDYHRSQHERDYRSPNWDDRGEVDRWESDHVDADDHAAGKVAGALIAAGVIAAIAHAADDGDDDRDDHGYRRVVTCESDRGGHHYCSTGHSRHIVLKRQLSRSPCRYNRTWGYDRGGIWVDDGCRAEFWVD